MTTYFMWQSDYCSILYVHMLTVHLPDDDLCCMCCGIKTQVHNERGVFIELDLNPIFSAVYVFLLSSGYILTLRVNSVLLLELLISIQVRVEVRDCVFSHKLLCVC